MKVYASRTMDSHDLLKEVLKAEYGMTALPEIERGPEGKPFFPEFREICFNLSDSSPFTLCAVDTRPVGADIECIRPRRENLPRYAFTQLEYLRYEELGADWDAFYTLWVRKEAWCKYTGVGLSKSWKQDCPSEGLCFGDYEGSGWKASVCGESEAPSEVIWLESGIG